MKSAEKHFLVCILSWCGLLKKKAIFFSRVVLFLRVLKVIVNDFCKDKLDAKYSNFVNVDELVVRVFEGTEKQLKFDRKIKKNKRKKKIARKKLRRRNKKKSLGFLRVEINSVNSKISELDLGSVSGTVLNNLVNKKFRLENTYENRVLSRSVRRVRGLDKAYVNRLNRRRESRGEEPKVYLEKSINSAWSDSVEEKAPRVIDWDRFDEINRTVYSDDEEYPDRVYW